MKKDGKQRLYEVMGRLDSTFKPKLNENRTHDYIRSAKTLEELEEIIRELRISKGDLMKIAYNENTRNIDSALPAGIWNALEPYGGTYWFVMDYNDNSVGGKLVHLGEKILGIETDWNEKIRDADLSENTLNENSSKSPINKFVMFAFNYPPNFIADVWSDDPGMAEHLQSKFSGYYDRFGSDAVMNRFYVELDHENKIKLEEWVINNYNG
jgi:hypothetical protein